MNKGRNIFFLWLVWIVGIMPVSVHSQSIEDRITYYDLLSSETNPRNSEGDFVTLKDGRVLFAYTRFMDSSSDHAPAQIMGRFSDDQGLTWTPEDHLVVPNEGQQNVMSASFLRLQNGHIALFYIQKNSLQDCIPHVRISTDEANTWSDPIPIINDQKGYFVLNNDRVIQLESGRILAPVSLHNTPNGQWSNRGEIRCYYSDDMGLSWKRGQSLPAPPEVITQEPGVTELRDGRVFMNIRANHGVQYKSYSHDGGVTWSLARPTNIASPISPASVERLPGTGDLILAWNFNGKAGPGYFKSKRTPLTIAISTDEGLTWKNIQPLEKSVHASYAYTAIHQVGDYVLFGYYIKHDDKPGYDLRIKRMSIRDIYKSVQTEPVLIVANKHSNTLSYLDPVNHEVLETIQIGNNPHEIAISPDQRMAYLSSYEAPGNAVLVVDLMARQQVATIPTDPYTRIHGAAFSPDGHYAYFTAGQSGYVIEVETRTNTVLRAIPTGGKLSHMVYLSPDGEFLLTSNINSQNISVIHRQSGKLETLIPAGEGVEGMAFTPDGKYVWALNQTGGSITIIDWLTRKVDEEIPCPGMPVRLRFTSDGKKAVIANWIEEGRVTIMDVETKKEIKRIPVGRHAIGVEISPDNQYAYVGCEDAGKSTTDHIGTRDVSDREGQSDGVHVIDLEKMEVVKVIKTGLGPDPMQMWWPPNSMPGNKVNQ